MKKSKYYPSVYIRIIAFVVAKSKQLRGSSFCLECVRLVCYL